MTEPSTRKVRSETFKHFDLYKIIHRSTAVDVRLHLFSLRLPLKAGDEVLAEECLECEVILTPEMLIRVRNILDELGEWLEEHKDDRNDYRLEQWLNPED